MVAVRARIAAVLVTTAFRSIIAHTLRSSIRGRVRDALAVIGAGEGALVSRDAIFVGNAIGGELTD
jgi:hypothetical protein